MTREMKIRLLALILAVMTLFSALPTTVFADYIRDDVTHSEDTCTDPSHDHDHDGHDHDTGTVMPDVWEDEDNPVWDVLIEMNAILVRYLGTASLSTDETYDKVVDLEKSTRESAVPDVEKMIEKIKANL